LKRARERYPYTLAPSTNPSGSACRYRPAVGSQSRMRFWCRPLSAWNHWPGKRAGMGVPTVVLTPPKAVIAGGPDLYPRGIRRKHRTPNMVGADEGDDTTLQHRNRLPSHPDIFPDQCPCGLVVFRNPPPLGIEHGMDRDPGRGNRPDRLTAREVIPIRPLKHPVDRHGRHPPRRIMGVGIPRPPHAF
jgi:hypothetical protein